ncbi:DUF2087 domain-containing protein [Staphylospora marina]|uniref:DUF2087 domain-containing protein n=1 Tax=Staphylospora marina TaxID=2490858 RepID=UPI000F5BF098|nr:DUF2087 domain-containing protein [Staphylospora marina]
MDLWERFWEASLEELKRGYTEEGDRYICLLCGKSIEKGIIYPVGDVLVEAERYTRIHIEQAHGSVFDHLIHLGKKFTGLTDHQNRLLRLFYQGKSDREIQLETGIGSASTIRNHRFALKEKERQGKVFLVLMELLKERDPQASGFVAVHKTATMVDDRYNITREEYDQIAKKFFPAGINGRLSAIPAKEKQKLVILREIAKRFRVERVYTEKEINDVLKAVHEDFVTLRRSLIQYGFLDRTRDGSSYWLKTGFTPEKEGMKK